MSVRLVRQQAGAYVTDQSSGTWWAVRAYVPGGHVTQAGWAMMRFERRADGYADLVSYRVVWTLADARRLIDSDMEVL